MSRMDLFPLPIRLAANPQLYDYIHALHFRADGSVEMLDGAGQAIIAVARGNFTVENGDESSALISFKNLIEVDAYNNYERIGVLEPFTIRVVREEGPFVVDIPLARPEGEERLFNLFRERYVFETDPLTFARQREQQNLYFHLNVSAAVVDSARDYYPIRAAVAVTAGQLEAMGIR